MDWTIAPLAALHQTRQFCCGKPALDGFLKRYALENQQNDLGRTFVATEPEQWVVAGYYTLSSSKVAREKFPPAEKEALKVKYEIPAVLLGRLAVDAKWQGKGLGKFLLLDALRRAVRLASSEIGARAVEVDAIDDEAKTFYEHLGFVSLLDEKRHLYLPMSVIRKLKLR